MLFKESEFSWAGKLLIYLVVVLIAISSATNLYQGRIAHPASFIVVLSGFILFLFAKIMILRNGCLVSFGAHVMSNGVANVYRSGYWLMTAGFFLTFAG